MTYGDKKMGDQLLAVYIYSTDVKVHVYGFWDEQSQENTFDFYDVYLNGICINEGDPYHTFPSWWDVKALVEMRK